MKDIATSSSLVTSSDKNFWHGYIDFYEPFFESRSIGSIAEIGIFKGNSIRWLLDRFPEANIYGADILPLQNEWPVSERFNFLQTDQGDVEQLNRFFSSGPFDLIIEDGSHFPEHQALYLIEGVRVMNSGGIYILKDVHTSHPMNIDYNKKKGFFFKRKIQKGNALSVLLGINHYKRIGCEITNEKAELISKNSLLTTPQVLELSRRIKNIHLYKRTRLPDSCYKCGEVDFDYSQYRCRCGENIFSDTDSMTFVIECF